MATFKFTLGFLLLLAVFVSICHAWRDKRVDQSWKNEYKLWRKRDTIPMADWLDGIPPVKKAMPFPEWNELNIPEKREMFEQCITKEAVGLSKRVKDYRSPDLLEVKETVSQIISDRGLKVSVAVFWGRIRYVSILWPYLERNLAVNGGIVDEVLLITRLKEPNEAYELACQLLESAVAKYPGIVKKVLVCSQFFGCVYDKILNDPTAVYIKLDDDIVFIKDGSFEHLAYQVLTSKDYTVFSGAVVNHPHLYAIHKYVGAETPDTFHYRTTNQSNTHPVYDYSTSYELYWGRVNSHDWAGAQQHESFVFNAAMGRLDAYTFDLWNLNECRCVDPQPVMEYHVDGFYRWSINVIGWLHNTSRKLGRDMARFDEPVISMEWPRAIAPHRAGIVGESLFVHFQYSWQRNGKPDYGLKDEILLPWYTELMRQYTASPFGGWTGNGSLVAFHEQLCLQNRQKLYNP